MGASQIWVPEVAHKKEIRFYPVHPTINENRFQVCAWSGFYWYDSEAIPCNNPVPRANCMQKHSFIDANHSGGTNKRRSYTGILLLCNKAPIIWFSKRHNLVEASTFGSEFTETNNSVNII